jgi:hypothetical protein
VLLAASLAQALTESRWGNQNPLPPPPAAHDDFSLIKFYSEPNLFQNLRPNGSILILDQFEEVFQYHKHTVYFARFIDQLSEMINAPTPEVRVLFSIREEFLGELSVFDNKISDLFNNYYRLKNPSKRQAREIIAATVRSKGVEPSEKMDLLVQDLLSFTPKHRMRLTTYPVRCLRDSCEIMLCRLTYRLLAIEFGLDRHQRPERPPLFPAPTGRAMLLGSWSFIARRSSLLYRLCNKACFVTHWVF